ncbi:MAG: hypothetical protein AB1485_04005 [Candidatus Thermoplasmatota archaeon]
MEYRDMLVLFLLHAMNKKPIYGRTRMQKLIFLAEMESKLKLYKFVPFEYGPFSFDLSDDIQYLIDWDYISEKPERFKGKIRYKYELTEEGEKKVKEFLDDEKLSRAFRKPYERIEKIKQTYYCDPLPELLKKIYDKYPEYAGFLWEY